MPDTFTRSSGRSTRPAARLFLALYLVLIVGVFVSDAAAQPGISVVGQLSLTTSNSDIWGYVNPVNNREYAVVGTWGLSQVNIVDANNPSDPILVKTLTSVPSFDLKTWQTQDSVYLYLCDGDASGNDSQVWNITDAANPTFGGFFPSSHNITIDDQGYMYLSYSTLRIFNLNLDPNHPTFVWTDSLSGGHDATVIGDRLYDFHGYQGTFIYDVSNRNSPNMLGMIPEPSDIHYHHSGWTSADGRFLFINDELGSSATADITVWDITNEAHPLKVGQFVDPNATIHNSIRVGNFLLTSFYVAGFRVFDIGGPWNIYLYDEYDTSPGFTGNGTYAGCWGVYAGVPSGHIYASDIENGLFVFSFTPPTVSGAQDDVPNPGFVLNQNYPNPFNPVTTISYELPAETDVSLRIYNASGELVRTLVRARQPAGPTEIQWDGRSESGRTVASGAYFYKLQAGELTETRRMILLK